MLMYENDFALQRFSEVLKDKQMLPKSLIFL